MTQSHVVDKQTAALETIPALKEVAEIRQAPQGHWVGDGFPVRTIFAYDNAENVSPFLLMDYAGPAHFPPAEQRRGVGEHPHRGFETVTVVYAGEVEHRDSGGNSGKIGPGDVQWMTAGSGVVHEEMHSHAYTKSGGPFEAIQLWVNLPARLKMTAPKYQTLIAKDIPHVVLPLGAGSLRVIAGTFEGVTGPAETFTPTNLWDAHLKAGSTTIFRTVPGHTAAVFVMKGSVAVNGQRAKETEFVILDRNGEGISIEATGDATVLILSGQPLDEPIVGYGPFVMNTQEEIHRAMTDYHNGRMGHLPR